MRAIALRESKTEAGGTFCWRNFCSYIIIRQVNAVIVWLGYFRFMRKPAGAFGFVNYQFSGLREDGKHTIIVHPRRGLVCLFKAQDLVGIVSVLPAITHSACLRSPEVHPPRQGHCRVGVPV